VSNTEKTTKRFTLENLDCADCAVNLETQLAKLDTVRSVSINFATSTMQLEAESVDEVLKAMRAIEPDVKIKDNGEAGDMPIEETPLNIQVFVRIGAALILLVSGLIFRKQLQDTPYRFAEYAVFIIAYLISGWEVLYTAARNIYRGKVFDEHFLMSIATIGAFAIHALPEAVGVMLFFKIGEYFEQLSLMRSRKSIKSLLALKPAYANLERDGKVERVKPEEVEIGDIILVKPGERVPLDGDVLGGSAQMDISALTGESVPRKINDGDTVLSGMIVISGSLRVEVNCSYKDSSISRILDLVENATKRKAETEKFITTFARYYAPFIVALALGVALVPPLILGGAFRDWIYRALVILVVGCPCALVISVPLSYFGGIGSASRRGILIKGSNYIDALSRTKTVVFDKTGTLTKGIFKVLDVKGSNGFQADEILEYAACAESHSNHPIAESIREAYARDVNPSSVTDYQEIPGHGIKAMVSNVPVLVGNDRLLHEEEVEHPICDLQRTAAHVVVDGVYAGYIIIGDEIKEDAVGAVGALKTMGDYKTVMLTGDNEQVAGYVSGLLGMDEYRADLLPEDKVHEILRIQETAQRGEKVAFVGDGINDAPVIAQSDVGIAMGRYGAHIAIDTADVVLMTDSPEKIPEAISISRRTRRIVYQNIVIALGIKLAFVGLGLAGIATMWEAVFADVGVTLVAIFNALRVLR
jgi:Cd2+/Zn2+-exporting ATPase